MLAWTKTRTVRGLAFDIENMPGTYGPGDYTHPKVTAIGWQFLDRKRPRSVVLNRRDPDAMREDAEAFRAAWDAADFAVGHNIRRHDVKILNGLYTSLELPLLRPKRMVDTYLDQPKMQGLSRSLENLAARWGCPEKKLSLSEHDWERAYDGIPEGVALMRRRVESDVRISIWLYHELLRRELL
jgi:hypothetical protein